MRMEDLLAVLFIFENMTLVGAGLVLLTVHLLRARKERRVKEDGSVSGGDSQGEIADMRADLTQMREMMADVLRDTGPSRHATTPAEPIQPSADPDR
ncbi:hypothetical protein HOK31_06420 [Candidatus Poribacteria bacterium]|nr:hypothetical protein [Candidatus Poribacteria bacterium]MBT5715194.1 hypothetical protein [Candidatus Poribacteria bacterium]MBT7098965.1 hypothetical protein [Candidatus Poribacteria bacterium]MBT7804144.1 hypothetical protein [Candidatus Poribacteria bacterium]